MVRTFHLSGLKCQGCVANVTAKLSRVLGVAKVEVDLTKSQVTITGRPLIFLLKRALRGTSYQLGKEI